MTKTCVLSVVALFYTMIMTVSAAIPEEVCYYNTQKCCYGWAHCGYDEKKVEEKYDCPYQKCDEACKPHCENKEHCEEKTVGKACSNVYSYGHYKLVCKPKIEKVCSTHEVCKEVCHPHCHNVYAKCVKYLYYEYAKYCPNLHCHPLKVTEGSSDEPEVVVDSDGVLKNTVDGGRVHE